MKLNGYYKKFGVGQILLSGRGRSIEEPVDPIGGVVWLTEPDLGSVAQGETFRRMVRAESLSGEIDSYTMQAPETQSLSAASNPVGGFIDIPETIDFNTQTGELSGYYVSQEEGAPFWQTPRGFVGRGDRGTPFSANFVALPGDGREIVSYGVVGRRPLPAGLIMNGMATSAVISGIVDLYANDYRTVSAKDGPSWLTSDMNLGTTTTSGETFTANVAVHLANSQGVRFGVVGSLPMPVGLVLNPNTGVIAGSADATHYAVLPFENYGVEWQTEPGLLGTVLTSVSRPTLISLNAISSNGGPVSYRVLEDRPLPAGTVLNVANSTILAAADPQAHTALPEERLSTVTWVTPAGSLGTAKNGQAVSLPLSVTLEAGQTANVYVIGGGLPDGTTATIANAATGTFRISGTLNALYANGSLTSDRVYTFTIRAADNQGGYADQTFSYTVNP